MCKTLQDEGVCYRQGTHLDACIGPHRSALRVIDFMCCVQAFSNCEHASGYYDILLLKLALNILTASTSLIPRTPNPEDDMHQHNRLPRRLSEQTKQSSDIGHYRGPRAPAALQGAGRMAQDFLFQKETVETSHKDTTILPLNTVDPKKHLNSVYFKSSFNCERKRNITQRPQIILTVLILFKVPKNRCPSICVRNIYARNETQLVCNTSNLQAAARAVAQPTDSSNRLLRVNSKQQRNGSKTYCHQNSGKASGLQNPNHQRVSSRPPECLCIRRHQARVQGILYYYTFSHQDIYVKPSACSIKMCTMARQKPSRSDQIPHLEAAALLY